MLSAQQFDGSEAAVREVAESQMPCLAQQKVCLCTIITWSAIMVDEHISHLAHADPRLTLTCTTTSTGDSS